LSDIDKTAPDLADALRRGVEHGQRVTRGEAVITLNGRRFPIGLTTTTMEADHDTHGSLASATVIFQDISDNKRLEELRLRAERLEAVTELSASLAHEIKNPLASIRSAVEQLARVPSATDDERTLSALIVRESDRLSRLLSEFLDFARVRVTRIKNVDLVTIARAAATTVSAHPDCKARLEVRAETPSEPLLVEGDEDLLHRAVFNIALNAVQATPEGRRVTVEVLVLPADELPRGVSFGRDAVALRVSDEGPGIPEAIRDRVFDPFFTTKAGGTGLGLPIVHRAIEAHRGLVFLDSNSRGTRFTVLLPRWQPDEQEVACPAA
jgi:signal transduction histidine kinase